jgi:hypothetical protein
MLCIIWEENKSAPGKSRRTKAIRTNKNLPNNEIIIQSYYIRFILIVDIKRYLKELIQKIK